MLYIKDFKWGRLSLCYASEANLFLIHELSVKYNWKIIAVEEKRNVVKLLRDESRMTITLDTLKTITLLNHPRTGIRKLVRVGLTEKELKKVFDNPRAHTGKGFFLP